MPSLFTGVALKLYGSFKRKIVSRMKSTPNLMARGTENGFKSGMEDLMNIGDDMIN